MDLMTDYNIKLPLSAFVNLMSTLKPRLYTIASSKKAYPDSIHMTISLVRDIINKD